MHQTCLDYPLHKWFDFKVPKTFVDANYIKNVLNEVDVNQHKATAKIIYLGNVPSIQITTKSKKGNQWEVANLTFETKKETIEISITAEQGKWLLSILSKIAIESIKQYTFQEIKEDYEKNGLEDFELFWDNKPINTLYKVGLLEL